MVIRDGLNSRKINLKFTNGTIDTFGYSSTGKISESVDALAAMISKGTDALTELNALKSLQTAKAPSNTVELYEIVIGVDKTTLREVTRGEIGTMVRRYDGTMVGRRDSTMVRRYDGTTTRRYNGTMV